MTPFTDETFEAFAWIVLPIWGVLMLILGVIVFRSPRAEARTHLIWSRKWGCWHRRCDKDAGARGYTDDIAQAGVFETSKALAYHDDDDQPDARDKAVPLAEVRDQLLKRRDRARQDLRALTFALRRAR